ncbi:AI-2E family transporter [Azoarcus indigens]|uniref:Putative PurR-regulated permease PerM n=1 Tax=Azoarcus indigens TaxID=29545 RepID=A0A4R6ECL7_9RHOO|nr:AI-2E family transporter [Azoarcus indigens]NMG65948.1 AI-2E family transporter [Azoarcus indigens]TDN55903.1 putative PurR-regulated permease PerM [Azoarcus indigens]
MSAPPAPQPRRRRPRAAALGPAAPGVAADARRADRSIVVVGAVVLLVGFGLVMWAIADVVLLVFAGMLLAIFLRGFTDALRRATGLPDMVAFVAVVLALLALLALGGLFLGAEAATQFEQLGPRTREAWDKMLAAINSYEWGRALLNERNLRAMMPENQEWLTQLGGLFSTTVGAIGGFLIVVFIGLYGAADPGTYQRGFLALFPRGNRERASEVMDEVGHTLRWWLIGTFVKMTVVGVSVSIGLWLLGMPLALALGLIAFVLDFVPYIGPALAAFPALLVALAMSPTDALYVGLLYLGVQAAENYIVSPLVDLRSVDLPPALAIAAQVLLGALLGALGVVFATPLAATGMVLVRTLYVEPDEPAGSPAPAEGGAAAGERA